jgi:diguanylate cyclase (GGDEF)-like protein
LAATIHLRESIEPCVQEQQYVSGPSIAAVQSLPTARVNSIKSQIMVFAVLATLVPSLGLGLLSFHQNETQTSENVTRQLHALTNYASREIEFWRDRRVHEVHVTATSNAVIDTLSPPGQRSGRQAAKDAGALGHYLNSVTARLDTILELTVVDAKGMTVASSARAPVSVAPPNDWPPNAVMEGRVVVPPKWDDRYGTASITVAIPVLSYDNLILGAVIAVLDLKTLEADLKSPTKSPPGEVLLLDSSGTILVSSQAGERVPGYLDTALLQRLTAQPGNSQEFRGASERAVLGLADTSTDLGVTILAERDLAEIQSAWIELRNMFLALVGTLILIVAAIAFKMGTSIVSPLRRLIRAADRIAEGDLEVELVATRNDELGHLTRVFNQMADRLRRNHAEITAANEAMQKQNQMLETLSITDSLTGLYNRSKLDAILADQLARYNRTHRPFSLLMLDIDHFKTLNDTWGHLIGDEILSVVARILLQSVRSIDYAARYGGDEFTIILVETPASLARKTAERIRSEVESMRYRSGEMILPLTVSIGIVECQPQDETPTALLSRVDSALYEAKRAGRNQAYCPHKETAEIAD